MKIDKLFTSDAKETAFNIALELTYDGTHFWGWQKTLQGPTIEETLQLCLKQIYQETFILQAASRTDRGVHAEGQWINFFCNKKPHSERLKKSLNSLLPSAIRVVSVHEMPFHFHPTLHALKKEYNYEVSFCPILMPKERFYCWHVPYPLNLKKMEEACFFFLGQHDFTSFCNNRKNLNYPHKERHIETLQFRLIKEHHLLFTIIGNNFLYKMVRNIVGTLIYVGREKISPQSIPAILIHQLRAKAGITAPGHGLTLKKVYYPKKLFCKKLD